MMFYRCCECGEEFDTPDTSRECIGEFWGTPAYMDFDVCPRCGSDEFEEVFETEDEEGYEDE